MKKNSELFDVTCILKRETELAVLVDYGDVEPTWLPKSMIEIDPPDYNVGNTVIITLPTDFAQEKGII
jgi:hypothetical protein